jgi:hypothetical protein
MNFDGVVRNVTDLNRSIDSSIARTRSIGSNSGALSSRVPSSLSSAATSPSDPLISRGQSHTISVHGGAGRAARTKLKALRSAFRV